MTMRQKPSNKDPGPGRKAKPNTAGRGESSKTRADVPATHARKAASGKQVGSSGGSGGRGRGKG